MREKIEWILKSSNFKLIDLPNNYFAFGSEDKALSQKLLFEGPWLIQGHYLVVQRWSPNFNPYSNSVGKIAVWARVPTLPMHCFFEELMLELGNMCGKALKVDMNTLAYCKNRGTTAERGRFARVSVELDLNQRLKSKFVIRNRIYRVEYESVDVVCFHCGKYGHRKEECSLLQQEKSQEQGSPKKMEGQPKMAGNQKADQPLVNDPLVTLEEDLGGRMLAKRTFKQRY
ncbi:uncharacterized protein LOC129286483 [Prosopis cineraria]|uniref:uncharacterized protein LOC129286483 n=1 Tax=Prosopis cineraria TaxID=364024 RepID=UPI00240FCD26|nr:uncharacterized protein LOC129286483 [Prosopis cineraria]